jgi:hypothetical protein
MPLPPPVISALCPASGVEVMSVSPIAGGCRRWVIQVS